jgi:hypothetical protein
MWLSLCQAKVLFLKKAFKVPAAAHQEMTGSTVSIVHTMCSFHLKGLCRSGKENTNLTELPGKFMNRPLALIFFNRDLKIISRPSTIKSTSAA